MAGESRCGGRGLTQPPSHLHLHMFAEDMAGFSAKIEPAITYEYEGWTVGKCGPWSVAAAAPPPPLPPA